MSTLISILVVTTALYIFKTINRQPIHQPVTLPQELAEQAVGKEQIRTIVPAYLSSDDVTRMIKENGYYDGRKNPNGLGIDNKFEPQHGDSVVYDAKTRLTWQQPSSYFLTFEGALAYIDQKNRENYCGFTDWRLPTLKEAMSLMSPDKKNGLHIDPLFAGPPFLWTSDKMNASTAWAVDFANGLCDLSHVNTFTFVSAVRSGR